MRYQVTVFAWKQSPQGEMQLDATQEVVFFPALLSLAPGEQRNLRVGTSAPFGELERSYRLFVEELPPAVKAPGRTQVRVLTRIGIPIFLEPASPVAKGAVSGLGLLGDRAVFTLKNAGNVRLRPTAVRLVARGAGGEILSERSLEAWYVLAGTARIFDAPIPKERCADVRTVSAEVSLERGSLRAEIAAPRGACAR